MYHVFSQDRVQQRVVETEVPVDVTKSSSRERKSAEAVKFLLQERIYAREGEHFKPVREQFLDVPVARMIEKRVEVPKIVFQDSPAADYRTDR